MPPHSPLCPSFWVFPQQILDSGSGVNVQPWPANWTNCTFCLRRRPLSVGCIVCIVFRWADATYWISWTGAAGMSDTQKTFWRRKLSKIQSKNCAMSPNPGTVRILFEFEIQSILSTCLVMRLHSVAIFNCKGEICLPGCLFPGALNFKSYRFDEYIQ